jgi:hypothetical protein
MSDEIEVSKTSSYKCSEDESEGSELAEEELDELDSLGVPKVVKHHVIFGAKANAWTIFHKFAKPYETKKRSHHQIILKPSTHLCLLCLKKIALMTT